MTRLFDDDYTVAEYRRHLGRLLGLFEPLERAAADVADAGGLLYAPRRSSALREDLVILGSTANDIAALERCRLLPTLAPAGLWGCAYVILGSMLGGRIIVERLRAVLGPDASYRFYGGGDIDYASLWASFCAALEEHGRNHIDAICATAAETFDAYATWLAEPRVPPTGAQG